MVKSLLGQFNTECIAGMNSATVRLAKVSFEKILERLAQPLKQCNMFNFVKSLRLAMSRVKTSTLFFRTDIVLVVQFVAKSALLRWLPNLRSLVTLVMN